MLTVTFDEDDGSASNRIPTLFYGAHVATGSYREHITHYTVLHTLESPQRPGLHRQLVLGGRDHEHLELNAVPRPTSWAGATYVSRD